MRPRDSERNTSEWTRSKGMWGERYWDRTCGVFRHEDGNGVPCGPADAQGRAEDQVGQTAPHQFLSPAGLRLASDSKQRRDCGQFNKPPTVVHGRDQITIPPAHTHRKLGRLFPTTVTVLLSVSRLTPSSGEQQLAVPWQPGQAGQAAGCCFPSSQAMPCQGRRTSFFINNNSPLPPQRLFPR